MTLELRFLPAQEGDAVWVRWGDSHEHQLIIDMGREGSGTALRNRIKEELRPDQRHFELLVITHVDADHIGGVLAGVADAPPLDGLDFGDVWFNGWGHLNGKRVPRPGEPDPANLGPMGAAQGERLTNWLTGPWNEAFDRGPVERTATHAPVIDLEGGLRLTVLGPTRAGLEHLIPKWVDEVDAAIKKGQIPVGRRRIAPLGSRPTQPELETWADLETLAGTYSKPDEAEANGSSICVLLEWKKRRVLLTGDAWAPHIVGGLKLLKGGLPVPIDVVKLPHHGSEANFSDELADAITCPKWVVSTNGSRYYHPDAAAIARLLRQRRSPRPELYFNVPSEFNAWWDRDLWKDRFDYQATTGTKKDGITISLEPG